MGTVTVAGLRLPVPPTHARKDGELRAAAARCAAARANSFVNAGFANKHGVEQLTRLLQHAVDLNDYGASHGTRLKNETAWAHWTAFAELLGFEPVLTTAQVRDHPSEIGTLLATFLLYVYPKMKGKQGRQWAKPRSAFAYVLAIIRIFREWKLVLPPAKVVKGELHGLLRSYVNVYGVKALMPSRREPMKIGMLRTLLGLQRTVLESKVFEPTSAQGVAFRGILAVGWRTGHRLAEFVAHPSGEIYFLTRANVSYVIAGVSVDDPTPAQLRAARPGDVLLVAPPRSKTDQFGEIHCPFPSSLPITNDPNGASAIIIGIELDRPCHGAQRESTPLFADEQGQPFNHAAMDALLHRAIAYIYGKAVASCHSWHSLRIGLATALKAANVDDAKIQMICRWMNPESLRAYARHGNSLDIDLVNRAERAVVDSIQTANVPKVCNSEGNAALHVAFGGAISKRAREVLDAAEAPHEALDGDGDDVAPPPDQSPLTAENCVGRRVLVPRRVWPSYRCDENDGQGWTACVVQKHGADVTLHFVHATTARGLPYEDTRLQLSSVRPI